MKLISFNVNGLRAICEKNFESDFKKINADVFSIQETKLQKDQIPKKMEIDGYYSYWNFADKKGYSGTAVLSKIDPLNVIYGIGIKEHDAEGRVITLEYNDFYLVNVYVPNSQPELKRLEYRMSWEDDFLKYILKLEKKKPVIFCGDLNVAHQEIDLKNPKTNHFNPGFSDEERAKMSKILSSGYIDSFRYLHPEDEKYSWWSYRMNAREKNVGWRIDYFIVSEKLKDKIKKAEILNDVFGSDHCPVLLEINLE